MLTSQSWVVCLVIAVPTITGLVTVKRVIETVVEKSISWPRAVLIVGLSVAISIAFVGLIWTYRSLASLDDLDSQTWSAIVLAASWLATAVAIAWYDQRWPRPTAIMRATIAIPFAILSQALLMICAGIAATIATVVVMYVASSIVEGIRFEEQLAQLISTGVWCVSWLIFYIRGYVPAAALESSEGNYSAYDGNSYSSPSTPGYTAPTWPSPGNPAPNYTYQPPPAAPAYSNGLSHQEYAMRQTDWDRKYH
jgi:hypothetical protein